MVHSCPVCHGPGSPLVAAGGFEFAVCSRCSHQFLAVETDPAHTRSHYADHYFTDGGGGYADYESERVLLEERGEKYRRVLRRHAGLDAGRLLDVGCAAGFLSRPFVRNRWSVRGIEPNATMAGRAIDHGVDAEIGGLEETRIDEEFDAVLAVQVVAHLVDLEASFDKLRRLTRDGGYLLVETWNSQSLTARLFRGGWHEYNPPEVLNCFTRRSLSQLAARFGFEPVASKLTVKKICLSHGRSLLDHKFGRNPIYRATLRPLLNLLPRNLSVLYPADDLFWTLFKRIR